ncbi:MAG: threonylcarbamoyl-AMP synthase [Puniceicoccales bacterium]|nr:threonylcarbamoyl-AMP synthase [Puniceicoccales bacterium]
MAFPSRILNATKDSLELVSRELLAGGVVALPTETVYGLAAIITDEMAIKEIFNIKNRPFSDPLIVHVLGFNDLLKLTKLEDDSANLVSQLVDAFCPGPLTFVLPKAGSVSPNITASKSTLAIRIPAHKDFREVLLQTRVPLAAPSANQFGYLSPTTAEHVLNSLRGKIKYILDGGPCEIGLESTIIDIAKGQIKILRPGAITPEMLQEATGLEVIKYRQMATTDPSAPGLFKRHYSPNTKLRLFEAGQNAPKEARIAVIHMGKPDNADEHTFWLSENGDLTEASKNIFSVLRRLDQCGYDKIYCEKAPPIGLGLALNDRLNRAAAKFP